MWLGTNALVPRAEAGPGGRRHGGLAWPSNGEGRLESGVREIRAGQGTAQEGRAPSSVPEEDR